MRVLLVSVVVRLKPMPEDSPSTAWIVPVKGCEDKAFVVPPEGSEGKKSGHKLTDFTFSRVFPASASQVSRLLLLRQGIQYKALNYPRL